MNPTVGDIPGNVGRILSFREQAARQGAHLVVYPEMVVVGYPPEDLVLRPSFQEAAEQAVHRLAEATADSGPALLVSGPWRDGGKLHSTAILLADGAIRELRHKYELPNYGVFDEGRVFDPGPLPEPVEFMDVRLGVMTCEDMWFPTVSKALAERGAELLLAPNGSPFDLGKLHTRMALAKDRVAETGCPLVYANLVGGQDELVFDGGSFVMNPDGKLAAQMVQWEEGLGLTQWEKVREQWVCTSGEKAELSPRLDAIYQAMMLGLRDYVNKNRFPGVVMGLSGGIDSALSAAVAADALGPDRVHCVMLPSRYTSPESLRDAEDCAGRLGVRLDTVPINGIVEAFDAVLRPLFDGRSPDITEENIQARARGVALMALSNKLGHMVLTTGNKSEMSVGYATLYGDMCGGYSVLKDIYKTTAFELARWRNGTHPRGALGPKGTIIPESIITKPPTAELRENQTDQDSLPPYEQLDAILENLVENEMGIEDNVAAGRPRDLVKRIQQLLFVAEYKRRQAPPGVKITRKHFGRDRRYPITNRFQES
jgi:NAD+ synthase